ncbi:MAG TPA: hypothetical protein VMV52_07010 [Candidatus Nanopelagicaceae bacterium]|nr:hypothetical protein [Candidatus Nanopelagicaceae bacterium]
MSDYGLESRQIELDAIQCMKSFYGSGIEVVDLAALPAYDFQLRKDGKTFAIGEIAWLEDGDKRSTWKALLKQDKHRIVKLAAGQGPWTVILKPDSNINEFHRQVPSLITQMIAQKTKKIANVNSWPRNPLADFCRQLGINYIAQSGQGPDQAFYMLAGSGGLVRTDLQEISSLTESLLEDAYSDCWQKLQSTPSPEKHIYLRIGSFFPVHVTEPLSLERTELPIPDIDFPHGITHIWLQGSIEYFRSVRWSSTEGHVYF